MNESASDSTPASKPRRRKFLFRILVLAFSVFLLEGLSFIAIQLAPRWLGHEILRTPRVFANQSKVIEDTLAFEPRAITIFDLNLGWCLRPNGRTSSDQINSQGLRSAKEYSVTPGPGITRVSVFGDSFVYCTEVQDSDSWPAQIEQMFPDIEVLNYGVPAYGPDQAYLRFATEGAELSPHIVILGVSPVSLDRSVSVYRGFLLHGEDPRFSTKPRFILGEDGELQLRLNPLRALADAMRFITRPGDIVELGQYDYWYEPAIFENPLYDYSTTARLAAHAWIMVNKRFLDPNRTLSGSRQYAVFNASSDAFRIVARLIEKFAAEARSNGAVPAVLILPDEHSLARTQRDKPGICSPLVEHCRNAGVRCWDLSEAFRAGGADRRIRDWFSGRHYSSSGNKIIASWLGRALRDTAAAESLAVSQR